MPLDASDRIRKIQEIAVFQGYVVEKQTSQPNVNVSSCTGFYGKSNIHKFTDYAYRQQVEEGQVYFSTCRG
jgi:hypothetical protein